MERIIKSRYVEQFTQTTAGVQQYFFPDLTDIRDAHIMAMRTWDDNDVTVTRLGNTPPATADLAKAYLVLYFEGGEYVVTPVYDLVFMQNNATTGTPFHPFSRSKFLLHGQVVTWTKSYIWLGNVTGLTTGRYFHFAIDYVDSGMMSHIKANSSIDKFKGMPGSPIPTR